MHQGTNAFQYQTSVWKTHVLETTFNSSNAFKANKIFITFFFLAKVALLQQQFARCAEKYAHFLLN